MTIQSRKRVAGYAAVVSAVLFLYSLSFENDFVSKTTLPSTADYRSFIVPQVPNDYPTRMMNRAFPPRTNVTTNDTTYSSCLVTSQVQLVPHERHWILSSFDIHGTPKNIGGDEYYVTYKDDSMIDSARNSPTAVAMVQDFQNGSYKLQFVTSPSLTPLTRDIIIG